MLMPPQQTVFSPGQAPVPQNTGQYDFIMQGNHRPKGLFSLGSSMQTRIIIILGGCIVLLLVGIIISAIFTKGGNNTNAALLGIAQRQAELARISQLPVSQADEQSTQNVAATMYASMLSEQALFSNLLASQGAKPSSKQLAARQSALTDNELASAKTSGTYDQTYLSIASTQLSSYIQALKLAYAAARTTAEKQDLHDAYGDAQLLLTLSGGTTGGAVSPL